MPPKGKKGRRKGDDSDDDFLADQLAHLKTTKEAAGNDEESAKPATNDNANNAASKKDKKANKKKGGGGGKGRGNDSDDEDPLAIMKKMAKQSDDESDEAPAASNNNKRPPPTVPAASGGNKSKNDKNSKGKKGAGGRGGKGDSDDDEDPLAKMKALALADESDDDDEEDEAVLPPPKGQNNKQGNDKGKDKGKSSTQEKPTAAAAPSSKQKKQQGKSKQQEQSQDDDDSDDDDDDDSDYEDGNDEDDDEEEEEEEVKDVKKGGAPTKKAAVEQIQQQQKQSSKTPTPTPEIAPAPAVVAAVPIAVKDPEPIKHPAPTPATAPAPAPKTVSTPVVVPPPAPEPESVAAPKEKPKSKLELKLEKARKEKQEADAKAAAEAAVAAEEAKVVAKQRQIEEEAAAVVRAQEAAVVAAAAAVAAADNHTVASSSSSAASASSTAKADAEAEKEREARMRSTMYGDDVFSEYGQPAGAGANDNDEEDEEEGNGVGGRRKDKKGGLSNKQKRRLEKEKEAKEREAEYSKASLLRSMEGAQFAVSQSAIDPNDPQWQNALDIIIPSLSISAHNKELFLNAELNIVHGRRYGLVGPNGAGKSTLLKMIAAGELKVPPRVDYLYVEQEVMADETPAVDAVLKADKERWALIQEEKQLLADLEKAPDEAKDSRLGEVYEQLNQINAASSESKARRILFGLGFDAEMQIRPTKYFSGGWRMRISLARALFIEPTLLMLDEPTNHLDLNAVIWLDDYLQKWKKTLLVVSHDQDFLNSVCQEIIHLDDRKLIVYKGNYDTFKEMEAVKMKQQIKAWEKQERKLKELKAKGVTKDKAEKLELKSKAREPGARSKKADAAAAASGGVESGETQVELLKRPRDYMVTFSFPEVTIISPPILEVRDVNFRYGPDLPWLFRGVNFGLDMSSRVCIVGPNGSGKSTIIKIITGEVNPPEGEVRRNPRLRVGIYNQHFVDRLPMDEDPVSYLRRLFNEETYQSVRNKLGKYGLEGHAHTIPIRDLSGGQKARVVFVELSFLAPHLLFLDEPTNNLDIESIDALCDALKLFNGGVVMVSHDARLIETTDCQLWVVEEHNVEPWASGFKGYREHLLRKLEDQLSAILAGGGERPGEKKK